MTQQETAETCLSRNLKRLRGSRRLWSALYNLGLIVVVIAGVSATAAPGIVDDAQTASGIVSGMALLVVTITLFEKAVGTRLRWMRAAREETSLSLLLLNSRAGRIRLDDIADRLDQDD